MNLFLSILFSLFFWVPHSYSQQVQCSQLFQNIEKAPKTFPIEELIESKGLDPDSFTFRIEHSFRRANKTFQILIYYEKKLIGGSNFKFPSASPNGSGAPYLMQYNRIGLANLLYLVAAREIHHITGGTLESSTTLLPSGARLWKTLKENNYALESEISFVHGGLIRTDLFEHPALKNVYDYFDRQLEKRHSVFRFTDYWGSR